MTNAKAERAEKSPRYDQKLREILHKSAQVFAEKGFHNASMREISRSTGVSLAGLYYYFETKEELLFLILEAAFHSVLESLDTSLDKHQGKARVHFFISNHLNYFVNNLAEMKLVSHESDSLSGEYNRRIQKMRREYFQRLTDILSDPSVKKSKNGVDPKAAALILFGMINWVYTWYRPRRNSQIEEIALSMSRIFLEGYAKP